MASKVGDSDERASFRIWGCLEHVGENEFVAVAKAIPENGNPSEVKTLTETTGSLQDAREAAKRLVTRMSEIVIANGGRVSDTSEA